MFCPSVWFIEATEYLTFCIDDRGKPFHFTLTSHFPEKFTNTMMNMFGAHLFFKDTETEEIFKCELRFPNDGAAFFKNR